MSRLALALVLAVAGCNGILGLKEGHVAADGGAGPQADAAKATADAPIGQPDAAHADAHAPTADAGRPDAGRPDAASAAVCGNSIIDPGETCDDGAQNGEVGKCNATCSGFVQCDVVAQNCGAGMACDDDGNQDTCGTTCRVAGAVALNGLCTMDTDCAAGLACVEWNTTGSGVCHGLCDQTGAGCPTSTECEFAACAQQTVNICMTDCALVASVDGVGCPSGEVCNANILYDTSMTPAVIEPAADCTPSTTATLALHADCSASPFGCPQNSGCYSPDDGMTWSCVQLCHMTSQCTSGGTCSAFPAPMMIGSTSYNMCK